MINLENKTIMTYNYFMSKTSPLSTIIDADVKEAIAEYCKRRGLKLRYFIEQALIESMEDAVDLEAYNKRRDEELVDFEDVMSGTKKKKR